MLEGKSCLISRALPSSCEQESQWIYMTHHLIESTTTTNTNKRPQLPPDEDGGNPHCNNNSNKKKSAATEQQEDNCYYDPDALINPIGRDLSINCLIRSSRSDYGAFAHISRGFRSLIRSGEIYRLRRLNAFAEHWVYFSCNGGVEWMAYDPNRNHWMTLPGMQATECFRFSDKESLAVGTEILVFGKEMMTSNVVLSLVVLKYSILTHSWSPGVVMNLPRCLFGSASLGEKAIVAGGADFQGRVLRSAELYDSEKQAWFPLPSMNKHRKMCSGVFMDGKFYVIGGISNNTEVLTCGEEYDLEKRAWRVIPNMSAGLSSPSSAPPLVAVVRNELYAADYAQEAVRKYDKVNNSWITLGSLPERSVSMNGWGIAFRACGERLIVIGGLRGLSGGTIELNSWIPNEAPPVWNLIARKPTSGSFIYNCAVMGC